MILKLLFTLALCNSFMSAHQTGLSYVDIKEDKKNRVHVIYKKPLGDSKAKAIFIRYPSKCIRTAESPQSISDGFIINKYELWCTKDGLLNSRIWVDGLISSDRGVLIRYEKDEIVEKSLLRSTTPFIHINHKSSSFELFVEYVKLGVVHIWGGYDHLLFVLGMLLLAINRKTLLFAITGFTVAHSTTLAFGILGIVSVDILYVEAMIALSIVFLARELVVDDKLSFSRKYLGVVAFIFGLLHGFGFSSVLASIGLPQDEIPLSLFAFNLGIEIGQLLFIFALYTLYMFTKKYIQNYNFKFKLYIAYFMGAISSYWLIERVLSF